MMLLLLAGAIGFMRDPRDPRGTQPPTFSYRVVRSYPHDPAAFTQGLYYRDGLLYEGTGLNGRSGIRKVKLETGEVLAVRALPERYFGEGIAELKGSIFQLTWRAEIGFVYDAATLDQKRTFQYRGEGWGLTQDGSQLIMSDGTAQLRFLDPQTLQETRRVTVRGPDGPVAELNELEYVRGEIFANVWQTERIARISAKDGRLTGWIDLAGLLPAADRPGTDVMNGIAYDAKGDRLFVTGKLWPKLFEIKIVPR